jgi:hypothetical protein
VPFRQPPDYLLISEAAAATFAVVRLLHFRMWFRLPALASYLAVIALRAVPLSVLDRSSAAYLWVYMVASPLICCAAALSVREMFALIFHDYPGLRTAGKWALYAALSLSLGTCLSVLRSPWPHESPNTRLLFYELAFERSITFSLAVIIIILMIFLSRYPLHLDRNAYVASGFFSAMFLAQAVVRLVDTLSPHLHAAYADYPEVGFTAACLMGCGMMLRAASAPTPMRVAVNKPRETELLQQLESLNSILSRSVRR